MNAPPLTTLLIHGAHTGAWVWDAVRSHLAAPSIAVDLPGHGRRGGPLEGLRMTDCVDAAAAALPAEGRVVVVGHSLGGAVALSLAGHLRDRLAHLVLIAGPVPRPGEAAVEAFPFALRVASRVVLAFNPVSFAQSRKVAELTLLNGLPGRVAEEAAARFTRESTSLVRSPVAWSPLPASRVTYVRCLRDRGPLPPAHQRRMAARLGESVAVLNLDACHYAMLDKPSEVANVINEITDKTSEPACTR